MENAGFDTRRVSLYPDLAFKLPFPQTDAPQPSGQFATGVGVMKNRG
ncbi:hypothetical protein [Sinorhizobium fredii]|nr:hypothetical protein [Sinorhizobium fredii]